MVSGLHHKSFEDATDLAKKATIKMQQWLAEDIAAWDVEQPSKRQKTRHGDEPKGGTRLTAESVKEVVAAAIAAWKNGDNDTDDSNPDGECEDARVVQPTSMVASRPPPPEGSVTVRHTQIKCVLDCLTRTENGCRSAQRVLMQAAFAFVDEAKNIAAATDDIRKLIRNP